jgi:hypothetical protein
MYIEMNTETKGRPRRSERLSPALMRAFIKKVKEFDTQADAVEFFGFSRVALLNTLVRGTAKPSTVAIIRAKVGMDEAAA